MKIETYELLLQEGQSDKIYIHDNRKCIVRELIETDFIGFGNKGELYSSEFIECDDIIGIGEQFMCGEFSEIYREMYYLFNEKDNPLVDENGNPLFMEIFEGYDIYYLIDKYGNQLTDNVGNNLIIELRSEE